MISRRTCSLHRQVEIVPADASAWRSLAEYHYRPGRPGAIDKIFALRFSEPADEGGRGRLRWERNRPIGVIVYSMPIPNVAMRNRATNNRYTGLGNRRLGLQLLNLEMRWISRVVIHPQYRGIGLARRLVEETLERAGTVMVEAMAAMGRINPFFGRAGMSCYEQISSPRASRLIEAFGQVGIEEKRLYDPRALLEAIDKLEQGDQIFIHKEMRRFAQPFRDRRNYIDRQDEDRRRDHLAQLVVHHVSTRPVYYLWRRT